MFYAVAKGRKPGIYKTWQETKLQVIGVSALHKKFKTLDEAKAFLGPHLDSTFIDSCVASLNSASNTRPLLGSVSCTNSTNTRPSSLNLKNTSVHTSNPKNSSLDSYIDVYTDGSCLSNGQQGAQAGLGVFYGVNDPRNISERVPGAQTNNRGELLAPIRVLQGTTGPVKIHSDSKYVIDGVTKYLAHWKRNNFTTAKKTPVANQELWELLDSLMVGRNIKWVHVAAHTGIHGNEEADRLANVGALLPPPVDILRNNASRLDQFGIKDFPTRDIDYLLKHDLQSYALLMNPELEQYAAQVICKAVKSKIHSKTRFSIGSRFGYFLDAPLGAQGRIKSSLYYAFSKSGGILVAKVYTDIAGTNDSLISFKREVDFNKALDYIHSCGYCFADVKPSNIMMESSLVGNAKLIDFGSAIKLGETVVEISESFCLDVNVEFGSRVLDFTCLGSSLAQLSGIDISCYSLASELLLLIRATPKLEFDLAGACLRNGSYEEILKVINKNS